MDVFNRLLLTHTFYEESLLTVNTATPGTTLDLGTTIAGTEIATGIDISTTGDKYFNFTFTSRGCRG